MPLFWTQLLAQAGSALAALLGTAAQAPSLPQVEWRQLERAPFEHVGELRQLHVQHHSLEADWEPYLTPFSHRTHLALHAWSDAQLPWLKEEYEAPRVMLYVQRGSFAARLFEDARAHDRIVVAGRVRTWFLGRPWFEVTSARRCRKAVREGCVLHAVNAIRFMEKGAFILAHDQFLRALAAPLPAHARHALERMSTECSRRAEARG